MANGEREACSLAEKAAQEDEIEFDDYRPMIDATTCNLITELTDEVSKEIKNYGVFDREGGMIYDSSILDVIRETQEQQGREEYLQKHHMELDLKPKES